MAQQIVDFFFRPCGFVMFLKNPFLGFHCCCFGFWISFLTDSVLNHITISIPPGIIRSRWDDEFTVMEPPRDYMFTWIAVTSEIHTRTAWILTLRHQIAMGLKIFGSFQPSPDMLDKSVRTTMESRWDPFIITLASRLQFPIQ